MRRERTNRRAGLAPVATLAIGVIAAIVGEPVAACTYVPNERVAIEPRAASAGESVPDAPELRIAGIARGDENEYSCADLGVISLSIADDADAAAPIVLFEVLDSTVAASTVPEHPLRAGPPISGRRHFVFTWIDGADAKQEPLRLRLRATALSETGARGSSVEIEIVDPGR